MKARLVRIGNARGIRIPKLLLEQAGLGDEVEIVAQGDALVIRPGHGSRAGWDSAFQRTAQYGDDEMLDRDGPASSHWDENEWRW
jgi:antitoxin MazE